MDDSKYKEIALVSFVVGFILFVVGLSMAGGVSGSDLLLVYLVDATMFLGLIGIMFGVLATIGHLKQRSKPPENQMRTRALNGGIEMSEKSEELPVRPIMASITSVIIFLLGFALTVAATIAGVGMVMILPPLPSIYVIGTLFGLVAGPLLTLSGYNLWKMEKWAAQLAATILLFDLILAPSYGIDIGRLLPVIMNIIILVLIALTWKHLRNENLPHK
ncbi:hypothetical protein KAU55_03960 [Candidatus Bathyarchaeota archaeon]|nr:hypothetical protein [Candidatus Bathyarchaeota archaeon]